MKRSNHIPKSTVRRERTLSSVRRKPNAIPAGHPTMFNQLRYIAAYVTTPVSAITHYAPIRSMFKMSRTRLEKSVVAFGL
jgi:hypothetical protein